ncbi:MAG: hypothetical protein NZ901_09475 [Geminocystis sp.]|nr:hypothetical protein [Geminocystis sp.]HIK38872.1 hypothetical protein [Geminocystis sp. M7585_C2015_104]MCS7148405.1 hypothetical protein [Geminocystis sp.]MCX8078280.1 hypothetical protein [Geminocystis sp.]MDW8116007.1 hypothetical protein [Geminocystis sp.]
MSFIILGCPLVETNTVCPSTSLTTVVEKRRIGCQKEEYKSISVAVRVVLD